MIRQTRTAAIQIETLLDHYAAIGRVEAARNLLSAVRQALASIASNPASGKPHPPPYPSLARFGYRWIKVHRYWFGYMVARDHPVLTNVIFETADMQTRVADADDEMPIEEDGRCT